MRSVLCSSTSSAGFPPSTQAPVPDPGRVYSCTVFSTPFGGLGGVDTSLAVP
jgi:hypothetical protein